MLFVISIDVVTFPTSSYALCMYVYGKLLIHNWVTGHRGESASSSRECCFAKHDPKMVKNKNPLIWP